MKKILITGFEPFGKDTINPSWEAVSILPDQTEYAVIAKRQMPVVYDRVAILLEQAIEEEQPDVVLCIGQAGGRAELTPEMVALNIKDARIADNAGVLCSGEAICEGGPAAYFATVPVKRIAAAMREAGVPASVSYTAGTYVCNNIMYHLMNMLELRYPHISGGFIHIPFECGQVLTRPEGTPSLPLELMSKGLEAAVNAVAKAQEDSTGDLAEATGETH